ncbi:MAG: 50S ribosomal protein L11 [Candidatus Lokiarchaeota archaeon]|nr:50S ribosomal protein L11 [Candidatus Lokiarchaeota archaeon]
MGKKITVEALVDGGKASSGPPIGPALGPTGVNMGLVIDTINKKTAGFKGLKVPVTIEVDSADRSFEITVKTPMTSSLLFKEAGIEKGSGEPNVEKVADLTIDQVCNVARMKRDDINSIAFENAVRTVLGTAQSCGLTVDGIEPKEMQEKIKSGEVKVKE